MDGRRSGWAILGLLAVGLGLALVPIVSVEPPLDRPRTMGVGATPPTSSWLCLEPGWWSPDAEAGELRVRRADGGAFAQAGEAAPWVGVTFADLVPLSTRIGVAGSPGVLVARLPRLGELWDPAPQAGDRLLVAVYAGRRPLGAAIELGVRAGAPGPEPPSSECTAEAYALMSVEAP